jgi:hypothetical protein
MGKRNLVMDSTDVEVESLAAASLEVLVAQSAELEEWLRACRLDERLNWRTSTS